MKAYRYIHQFLFVLSFLPLVLDIWPFWLALALPIAMVIPFGVNEFVIDRRESKEREAERERDLAALQARLSLVSAQNGVSAGTIGSPETSRP